MRENTGQTERGESLCTELRGNFPLLCVRSCIHYPQFATPFFLCTPTQAPSSNTQSQTHTPMIRRFHRFISRSLLVSKATSCRDSDSFHFSLLTDTALVLLLVTERERKEGRRQKEKREKRETEEPLQGTIITRLISHTG